MASLYEMLMDAGMVEAAQMPGVIRPDSEGEPRAVHGRDHPELNIQTETDAGGPLAVHGCDHPENMGAWDSESQEAEWVRHMSDFGRDDRRRRKTIHFS